MLGSAVLPGAAHYKDLGLPHLHCRRKKGKEGIRNGKKISFFHQAKEKVKVFRFQREKY